MYLSYKWLKDFVEIPKAMKASELGDRLTVHTVEIDGVMNQASRFEKVVIGRILEISKHPQADKLQIALVDVGKEKLRIVCGAPNITVGMMVPVALVGAILPNGLEIKPAQIRGEESQGMLCAEDELGLGDDHSGIMDLGESAKLGELFSAYLGFDDDIFEVDNKSITNRPDLWGHYGMAREISVFLNTPLIKDMGEYRKDDIRIDSDDTALRVKIAEKDLCARYLGLAISGIKVEPSPKWLSYRLISVGIRPINNIVDITNYIMLELGQPMHAFDLDKIGGQKPEINVRLAKKGEKIVCLDGLERELSPEDLVIADDKAPIALAGIIGGSASAIDDDTKAIVLEAATFQSAVVRRSSARHSLRTEASQRFEKSLDPSLAETALCRALELVRKLCPDAKVSSRVVDEGAFSFRAPAMSISLSWLRRFLGEDISSEKVAEILGGLGFSPSVAGDQLDILIPSWRASKDVSIKEDIAEEIARIHGYDNIKPQMPLISMQPQASDEKPFSDDRIRQILAAGPAMSEVSNYSFVGEEQLKALGVDSSQHIRLANPISQNQTMLRQSLATNLIDNVRKNQARYPEIRIFEIGAVYLPMDGNLKRSNKSEEVLPLQEARLSLLVAADNDVAFMTLKSCLAYLCSRLGLNDLRFSAREKLLYWSDARFSASISIGNQKLGILNMLEPQIAKRIGIKKRVAIAELNLADLAEVVRQSGQLVYKTADKYPALIRDLAFILDENIAYSAVYEELSVFHPFIRQVEFFDEYHGDNLDKNKKSLAFRLVYQADKTLESAEVDAIQAGLIARLEERFEAKVRDF
jgi:phenylalanyl-tRNA synthetase beta chain